MMVVSANVASNSTDPLSSDRILTDSNLDDYHIYSQIVADTLHSAQETRNCSPFLSMLAKIVKPGFDEAGNLRKVDPIKLACVLNVVCKELGRMDHLTFTPIISAFLDFKQWADLHDKLTSAYLKFFNVLVSVNPKWWVEVAGKAVSGFAGGTKKNYTFHHMAIKQIMSNVPISSTSFSALFSEHFPHKSSHGDEILSYVEQLLLISEYAPDQCSSIWRLIIGRLVELDVECGDGDDSEDDSDSDSEDDSDLSDSESDFESESDEESVLNSDVDSEGPPSKRMRLDAYEEGEEVTAVELDFSTQPTKQKVDDVMTLLLKHLSTHFTSDKIVSGEATPLYNTLLQTFKEIVLPTARPRSVQFLWFFLVHGHPDLLASFMTVLLETAMSREYSVDLRCRALQYVASFVARAKGLSQPQLTFVVSFLSSWIKRYVKEREDEVESASSMAKFKVLYSSIQSLFYIFVFKHKILRTGQSGEHQWEADLDKLFPEIINTKFNPLQYCQPDVVAMFARIAQQEEVASCHSILERNRWGKFRSGDTKAGLGLFDSNRDSKLYDSYFPFQPMKLKHAKLFITDIYEKWSEQDYSESESDYE